MSRGPGPHMMDVVMRWGIRAVSTAAVLLRLRHLTGGNRVAAASGTRLHGGTTVLAAGTAHPATARVRPSPCLQQHWEAVRTMQDELWKKWTHQLRHDRQARRLKQEEAECHRAAPPAQHGQQLQAQRAQQRQQWACELSMATPQPLAALTVQQEEAPRAAKRQRLSGAGALGAAGGGGAPAGQRAQQAQQAAWDEAMFGGPFGDFEMPGVGLLCMGSGMLAAEDIPLDDLLAEAGLLASPQTAPAALAAAAAAAGTAALWDAVAPAPPAPASAALAGSGPPGGADAWDAVTPPPAPPPPDVPQLMAYVSMDQQQLLQASWEQLAPAVDASGGSPFGLATLPAVLGGHAGMTINTAFDFDWPL
ncbi:hypothetical protein C2E20_0531 [Micractinium conductrix]|uniref:Uncharacterized protein n=1 Tax=Micractinium conductrix TaxID=554055 RepID=A0A2P6VR03_9CHLO|nr:hypothetical protein C2E20_0531 [Micractinium conductrix]|eukprot:PSC76485.1 hypothetical protein C2E20_0531 [Micractinium conductrix]